MSEADTSTAGPPSHQRALSPAAVNVLLLLMVSIWSVNYTAVKLALREVPPLAFNGVRLAIASTLFLIAIWREASTTRTTPAEWRRMIVLAAVGHALYQLCFIGGLARTTVSNGSLIIGCSPVMVALLTAALGHERLTAWHWTGCALSVFGIYLIVGRGGFGGASLTGDALMVASIACWAIYTVGSRSLLSRHSPLFVTGVTMAIGAVLYLPFAAPQVAAVAWSQVSLASWITIVASAVLALFVAYWIWYIGVQQIGNARTSMYSNMVPVVGVTTAALWIGEPIDRRTLIGAAGVLLGVALTRAGRTGLVEEPPGE